MMRSAGSARSCSSPVHPMPRQRLVRRATGRESEGGAEMKAAQSDESGQFLEANVLVDILTHVRGDSLHLPGRKAPPWG